MQVNTVALSTVDYMVMFVLMMDMRVKLLEDAVDQQKEQVEAG